MIEEVGKIVGQGSYGEIRRASLKIRGGDVALKRAFVINKSDFGFSYRELDICVKMNGHPNICGASDVIHSSTFEWETQPPKDMRSDSVILVMPLAKGDLCNLCESELLSEVRIKRITAQILIGLDFMHSSGYIHRDIKPTNVLCYSGELVRICDFGLSKKYFPYDDHSSVAASDYFRSPEVLCLVPVYGYGLDIWSLGCTVHYMFSRTMPCPEWNKELGPYTQVAQVQAIIDAMPYEVSSDTLKDDPISRHLKYEQVITSDEFFSQYRSDVKDTTILSEFLIGGMLMFDQRHRLTARQLLDHPYMKGVEAEVARGRRSNQQLPIALESKPAALRARRSCCADLMYATYRDRGLWPWYKDKVLFTAITMFDRVLSIILHEYPDLAPTEVEIKTYYRTCLYISAKYYSASIDCDITYSKFPFPELKFTTMERAARMEEYIVGEVLGNCIYQVSIYDVATSFRKPRDCDVYSMLEFVVSGSHNGLTPEEAYTRWEDQALGQ